MFRRGTKAVASNEYTCSPRWLVPVLRACMMPQPGRESDARLVSTVLAKADGVAGQHRPDPAQFAKARRRSPDRDLLAARRRFLRLTLAVGYQQLHADRADMPARGGQPAEQRFAALFLVEMKALRIELRGEFLDVVGGEGERAEFTALADLHILEEAHQPAARAVAPFHDDRRDHLAQRLPACVADHAPERHDAGLGTAVRNPCLRDIDIERHVVSGRSGASQRISLTPGEPSEAVRPIKPSNIIRIMIEQRCQPEPDRPLQHRTLGGFLVQMHRLRVEFGGKGQNFLARDAARSESPEMAGREIFECQGS